MDGHDQKHSRSGDDLNCPDCRLLLQEYLDGTLEKKRSLPVFLHLRACTACRGEHDALRSVFASLDALPRLEAPEAFDAAILASVPYDAYRAMEPLRRARVPVFLEDEFLPSWVRARATRNVGLVMAAVAAAFWLGGKGSPWLPMVGAAALAPEVLVRLQKVGRRLVSLRQAEG